MRILFINSKRYLITTKGFFVAELFEKVDNYYKIRCFELKPQVRKN